MLFLLSQIFFFMCVSAALGAGLAWWWMKKSHVDVTEAYEDLRRRLDGALAEGRALRKEDVAEALRAVLTDVTPHALQIRERLAAVETALGVPDPALKGMADRMEAFGRAMSVVDSRLALLRNTDIEPLRAELRGLGARLGDEPGDSAPGSGLAGQISGLSVMVRQNAPPDVAALLAPLADRLAAIEEKVAAFHVPEVDLGPVHSGLARIDLTLSDLQPPEIDLTPISAGLGGLETRLAALEAEMAALARSEAVASLYGELGHVSDEVAQIAGELGRVTQGIGAIRIPEPVSLEPVLAQLSDLEACVSDRTSGIDRRIQAIAPVNEALVATLGGIEADLNVVVARQPPDLEPVHGELAALDEAVGALRRELRGHPRIEAIDRRLAALHETLVSRPGGDVSREDIGALEDRLGTIEYGISALQHMLRARSDGAARPEAPPAPRVAAKQPAGAVPAWSSRGRLEAIAGARRAEDEANLLTHAAFGESDDLTRIIGVGPILTELLHQIGVYYFWQIADWNDADIACVDDKLLHFRGRIQRDDWVSQARRLATEPDAARPPGPR